MDNRQDLKKLQERVVRISIVISTVIFILALSAGIVSDSVTMLLDASAGFVMVFMAIMLRMSIKKIHKPPDKAFNFGYEKFEPLTVVMQGAMIMLSCIIASYFALQDIFHAEDIVRYDIPMLVSFFAGSISLLTSFYLTKVSRKTKSHMFKASSLHWFVDSLLSFTMFLGFLFGYYMRRLGYYQIAIYVDPVMAITLAGILMWTPLRLMKSGLRQLLDAAPIKEVRSEIEKIVEAHKARFCGIHSIRMRRAGEKLFLDVCFVIHGHTTLAQAQGLKEKFEKDIAEHFPRYDVIVYFYPEGKAS